MSIVSRPLKEEEFTSGQVSTRFWLTMQPESAKVTSLIWVSSSLSRSLSPMKPAKGVVSVNLETSPKFLPGYSVCYICQGKRFRVPRANPGDTV